MTQVTITKRLPASVTLEKGMFVAAISTDSVDRDGEVLIPRGCVVKEFFQNPVVFYNHDYAMPIGKCVAFDRRDHEIVTTTKLADRPADYVGDFFPDFVRAMVDQGIIKGISVGFSYVPIEGGTRTPSKSDIAAYGEDVRKVTAKWKLLEYSIAPLQANQDALIQAVGKGCVTVECAKRWLGYDPDKVPKGPPPDPNAPPRPVKRHSIVIHVPAPRKVIDVGLVASRAASDAIAKRRGAVYVK